MRKTLIAGNWKLNKSPKESVKLVRSIGMGLHGVDSCEVLVCPPYVSLPAVNEIINDFPIALGAQNCADHSEGAYTGEISAEMLSEVGCKYVIVAHSERREHYQETDASFIDKINLVHASGMRAIFCYGEKIDDRRAGRAEEIVRTQLQAVLPQLDSFTPENTVLAYEPVWAIGTGETATPEMAQDIHNLSRNLVTEMFDSNVAEETRILYGGSMKPSNAKELIACTDIDGGLIGGASLDSDNFLGIIKAAL